MVLLLLLAVVRNSSNQVSLLHFQLWTPTTDSKAGQISLRRDPYHSMFHPQQRKLTPLSVISKNKKRANTKAVQMTSYPRVPHRILSTRVQAWICGRSWSKSWDLLYLVIQDQVINLGTCNLDTSTNSRCFFFGSWACLAYEYYYHCGDFCAVGTEKG